MEENLFITNPSHQKNTLPRYNRGTFFIIIKINLDCIIFYQGVQLILAIRPKILLKIGSVNSLRFYYLHKLFYTGTYQHATINCKFAF